MRILNDKIGVHSAVATGVALFLLASPALALNVGLGGVSASAGGTKTGGLGVGASVGGAGGVNAGTTVGGASSGSLGTGLGASLGGSSGVNGGVGASIGGSNGANAGLGVSVGGSNGVNAGLGASGSNGVNAGLGASFGGNSGTNAGTSASLGGGGVGTGLGLGAAFGGDATGSGVGAGLSGGFPGSANTGNIGGFTELNGGDLNGFGGNSASAFQALQEAGVPVGNSRQMLVLRRQCAIILASPQSYDAGLLSLCNVMARLRMSPQRHMARVTNAHRWR